MSALHQVVGFFSSDEAASAAAQAIREDRRGDRVAVVSSHGEVLSDGITLGAGAGSILALVATAALEAVPGFGPLLAMGPLAATLGGATVGGVAGALADLRLPDQPGRSGVSKSGRGRAAVVVASDDPGRVTDRLRQEGGLDVRQFSRDGGGGDHAEH